jgi:hypothetical protein
VKLRLPNDEVIILDTKLDYNNRREVVENILKEWKDHFEETWSLNKTKVCLEILSNYLCNVKEEEDRNKEDKYVLSSTKIKKMIRGDSKTTNFSNLPKEHQQLIGLVDYVDESGE